MKNLIVKILFLAFAMIASIQVSAGIFNDTICSGSPITIGNVYPTATLYQWNTTPPQYTAQITVSPTTNTSYIVNVFVGTNWLLADTFNIVVNPLPNGSISPTSQTVCAGSSATITASGGVTYLWTPGGMTTASIAVTPSTTTTYTCLITGSNGCSLSLNSTVTVNPLPTITVGSNSPVCSGTTINLTASANAGSTYAWTGPNGFTSNVQNPTIPNASSANAGTYSCIATLNGCSSTAASTTVVVNQTPVVNVNSNSPVCSGSNINLTATANAGSSYAWTGPNSFSSNVQNPVIVNASSANAGNYNCIATLNGCSSIADTTNVVVNPVPVITAIGSNSPVCSGTTITLTATANAGSTYAWTGPNGFSSNVQNPTIPNASNANAGNYNCVATLNGCNTNANTSVIVNTTPVISTIGNNSPLCQGSNLTFYASANVGSSYAWTGPNNFTSNQQNPVIPNASIANSGIYTCIVNLSGCSDTATSSASVVTNPVANISGNLSICVGESTTLTASGGTSYLWSTGETTVSIAVNPMTTTTYSVVATATGGCYSDPAFATVVVNPLPTIGFSPSNPIICEGESVVINANGASTYIWNNGTSGSTLTVSPILTTTYTVTGTSALGCSNTANITVSVNPKPIVSLNIPQSQICLDANPITLTGGYPAGGSYYGSGIFGGLFYPSTVGVGTYQINYEYTNTYGCESTASQLLTVNPLPTVIFNSIFPNPVDLNTSAFQLNTGIPLGGVYSGPGVVNGWFHPSLAGVGIHTITYTYVDFMSCSNVAMQTLTVVNGLGIEDEKSSSLIRIYPNPATDILNIETEEIPDCVQIVDITGKCLLSKKVDSEKFGLDVSFLSKGIYLLKFTYEDGSMGTARFVK